MYPATIFPEKVVSGPSGSGQALNESCLSLDFVQAVTDIKIDAHRVIIY